MDDAAGDGGYNTMTLQTPPGGLSANRVLIFPDSDGSIVTAAGPLSPNQILFGGPAGQSAQSPNLLWNNGAGIFDIGAGNFTVAGATGNTVIGGTLNIGFTPGSVVFAGAGGVLSQNNSAFFWNDVNERLGAGTMTPAAKLHGFTATLGMAAIRADNLSADGQGIFSFADGGTGALGMSSTGIGVWGHSNGAGLGFLASSVNGPVAVFDNATPGNANLVVNITNVGAGTSLTVSPGTGNAADIRGAIVNTTGNVTIADAAVVTGTIDLQSLVGNTVGNLNLADNVDVTGDLDVGAGNFTVSAATGAITGVSSLTLGSDATPTPGIIIFHDNTAANTFTGILQTANPLTATRTYEFPDADGTLALVGNIVTDASLTGDGSGGNPLGIDLTNANTWTGTQTLPTSAAQGDALIASTNSGTTTIDAARIGAGLNDAQVNNNLTINGGTVDATPVGATTPSTGVFTTITGTALPAGSTSTGLVTSNGGALETRTVASLSGSVAVSSNATLVGDGTTGNPLGINLANANTWTATQTYTNSTDFQGPIGSTVGNLQIGDYAFINGDGTTNLTLTDGGLDRNSGATETLSLDNTGAGNMNVLINGATSTTNSRLTVDDGHWTSQQTTAPGAAAAGANVATAVLANETDVAGFINITTSGTPAAGAQATVTFNAAYATAPIVVLTAANGAGAGIGAYVTRTTTTFTVNFIGVPAASTSYQFFYQVIETQ